MERTSPTPRFYYKVTASGVATNFHSTRPGPKAPGFSATYQTRSLYQRVARFQALQPSQPDGGIGERRIRRIGCHHQCHGKPVETGQTSRRGRVRLKGASGPCAIHGIGRRKICILHGSRSSSTRRSTWNRRGRHCMKCCAIDRAISCSTIGVSTKTRLPSGRSPAVPTGEEHGRGPCTGRKR